MLRLVFDTAALRQFFDFAPLRLCAFALKSLFIGIVLFALQAHAADNLATTAYAQAGGGRIAMEKHPKISVATLQALAAKQAVREVRSSLLPNVYASVTAAGSADPLNTRIAAGGLNNPVIYDRNAEGFTISQLITDFGRSWELTKSSKLQAQAADQNVQATRSQILLEINAAYFAALESQSVLRVVRETVKDRELLFQQVQTLATNKLKSELDVSFAAVDLAQARMLQAKAENDLNAGFATISTLLDEREPLTFDLAEETNAAANVTENISALILEALQQRPDLAQLRSEHEAAAEFARAEGKLSYPTISAIGTAGIMLQSATRASDIITRRRV